jgi:hypothetical protein
MNWWQRMRGKSTKPFYFYGWSGGVYVLEHRGEFTGRADARAEAVRIAERLGGHAHLHVLDHNHRLIETINPAPAPPGRPAL